MDGIPTELIFVLIFIVFSVLEGVGRKKKAQRKGLPGTVPGPQRRSSRNREVVTREPEVSRAEPAEVSPPVPTEETGGSEDLIPSQVWEEILGLARGTRPEPEKAETPAEEAAPEPVEPKVLHPAPDRSRPADLPSPRRGEPRTVTAVPSAAQRRPVPALVEPESPGPRRSDVMHRLFGSGSKEDLRKAIILREVLGPPVGMRE